MKKIVLTATATYMGLALLGLIREQRGAMTCACEQDCWCKRPPLALFRWVFPIGHRFKAS